MRRALSFVIYIGILFGLAFVIARFLDENSQMVVLRFVLWRTKEVALGTLVSISFLSGLVLTSLVLIGLVFSKSMEAKRLRRENQALQKMMEIKDPKPQIHSSSSK